jgi:diacylglycerol kinase (ATP)
MTYTVAALNILARFRPHEISISVDGGYPEEHMISLCTVGNGTTCGGGYRLTPRAVMDDGKLDLSVSEFIGRIPSMLNIGKAYRGDHIKRKENKYTQFRELKIKGLSGELPYHIDGEAGFSEKMVISVVRDGILCVHPHVGSHLA